MGEPAVAAAVGDAADRQTVLLVDDNATNLQALYHTLRALGPRVLIARDGDMALSIASETSPDLVLLDLMMPDMEGSEVTARLKEDPLVKTTPVVFLTAIVTREETTPTGTEIGGHTFLAKPVKAAELIACIAGELGGR